jgi:CheY-like chemotaxis protein
LATILIVENEQAIQRLLKALLVPEYRVVQALNPIQAIELAYRALPDLVILNVHLGGRPDGLELCRTLRSEPDPALAQVPILVLTGYTTETTMKAASAAGASSFIGKPFDTKALFELITDLLAKRE